MNDVAGPDKVIETKPLNIYQRINAVMAEIAQVRKTKLVGDEGSRYAYMAVTHNEVAAEVQPLFVKHGIVMRTSLVSSKMTESGRVQGNKELAIWRYEGIYNVAFVNIDDPKDDIVTQVEAHADDVGDKAPGKCESYAIKTAVLKLLFLESADGATDEERTEGSNPIDRRTEGERKRPQSKSERAQATSQPGGQGGDAKPKSTEPASATTPATPEQPAATAEAGQRDKETPAKAQKIKYVRQKLKEQKVDEEGVCKRLGITSLDEMTDAECKIIIGWAAKKEAAARAAGG